MQNRDRANAHRRARRVLAGFLGSMLLAPLPVIAQERAEEASLTVTSLLVNLWQPIDPLMSGAGSITSSAGALTCQNPSGSTGVLVPCQDGLSADELAALPDLTQVVLTAAPAAGWQFTGWSGTGCGGTTVACTISAGMLAPAAPVATFLPIPDTCTIDPTLPECPTPPPPGSQPPPSSDTTPPETTITSGPSGWLLKDYAVFGFSADEPASAFACSLDATPSECGGDKELVAGFSSGTHTFGVAATDQAGNQDPTPATRTFTMPRDDRALSRSRGWTRKTGSGYLMETYCATSKRGAKLTTKAASIRKIALVVGKGKGYGTVKVMLGKKVLKKVSLASRRTKKRALVGIATFAAPKSGKVSVVVVSSGKKVVMDGIGLATG